jgi:hypothetical protein
MLRDSLSGLLDGVEPAPPPVGAVMRTGKAIRTRRKLGIAGGLAAVVVAAVLVPAMMHQSRPAPAVHQRHYEVSVHPRGKHDPANLIAYGSVDGRAWRATVTGSGKNLAVNFTGQSTMGGALTDPGPATSSTGITAFEGSGGGTGVHAVQSLISRVSPGVRLITMTLANGTVLDLVPVQYRGMPVIAVELPQGLRVERADAYSNAGEVAYAIPFFYGGSNDIMTWLRPWQAAPAPVSAQVPLVLGGRWHVSVYIGPWGTCEEVFAPKDFTQGCSATTPTTKLAEFDMGAGGGPTVGVTRDDVAYFELAMSDGTTVRAPVVHLRGIGFYAIGPAKSPKVLSWTAYDAAGNNLGGGRGVPGGLPNPKGS